MGRGSKDEVTTVLDIYACQSRLVWANEREIEPLYRRSAMRADEHTVCWLIERGSVRVEASEGTLEARSGQWLFLPAEVGRQYFSPRSKLISMRFGLNLRGGPPVFRRERSQLLAAKDFPALEASARILVDLFRRWADGGSLMIGRARIPLEENFRIEAAFHQWLAAYTAAMFATGARLEGAQERDVRVAKALELLEEHPMREKFLESDLASRCGVSGVQLVRLFKSDLGISPFAYYERRRLTLARHALADTAMPVKEIAFELGFGSSPHFSNWFSQREGKSPRQHRREAASQAP